MEIFKKLQDKQEEIKNNLNEYKKLNEVCFFEVLFFLQELSKSHKVQSSLSLSNAKLQHSNNKTEQVYSIYFSTTIAGNIGYVQSEVGNAIYKNGFEKH